MVSSNHHPLPTRADAAATAPLGRPWTRRLRAIASGMVFALAGWLDGLADQRAHRPSAPPQSDHAGSGSTTHDQRGQAAASHGGTNHHHHHHGHGGQGGASGHGGHDGGGTGGAGRNLFDSPLATKARRMAHHDQAAHAANTNAGAGQGATANHAAGSAQTSHVTFTGPASTGTVIPMPGGAPPIVIGPDGFLVTPATGNAAGGAPSASLS